MVSIPACHAGNPGSIPGLGVFFRWVGKILRKRQWCIGNIEASQALAPGSTPGWRTIFWQVWKNNDPRGNRTPNLRVWNPTRYHCAMESFLIEALVV